jgi:leader peptidase (prepilin peptidase)/N-methyltransferase
MIATDNLLMGLVLAGLGGLVIGSFLNVVAYRLPRHESLVSPGSHCPGCHTPIKPYDNLPVLGWLLLHGRCRSCHEPISARYPLVEALTAALAVAAVVVRHGTHDIALGLVLVAVLVPVALIDFEHRLIPNRILAPAALAALAIGLATRPSGVPEQLITGAAAAGFLLVAALAYPRGMGMGDVKLAGVMGLFLGRSVAVALLVGVLAGVVAGAVIMARVGVERGRKTAVPFGPFLALGGAVAVLAGPGLTHAYVHLFHI